MWSHYERAGGLTCSVVVPDCPLLTADPGWFAAPARPSGFPVPSGAEASGAPVLRDQGPNPPTGHEKAELVSTREAGLEIPDWSDGESVRLCLGEERLWSQVVPHSLLCTGVLRCIPA